ncbi:hypothetical protein [Leisingera sp. JC11]|uniref:hypothetical protein n=1 Tax=Leisingera sp. JC11 TaxID=3042469 RepID=UPI003455364A
MPDNDKKNSPHGLILRAEGSGCGAAALVRTRTKSLLQQFCVTAGLPPGLNLPRVNCGWQPAGTVFCVRRDSISVVSTMPFKLPAKARNLALIRSILNKFRGVTCA